MATRRSTRSTLGSTIPTNVQIVNDETVQPDRYYARKVGGTNDNTWGFPPTPVKSPKPPPTPPRKAPPPEPVQIPEEPVKPFDKRWLYTVLALSSLLLLLWLIPQPPPVCEAEPICEPTIPFCAPPPPLLDCLGVPNGNSIVDDCGVCNGSNQDKGCDGVCFSGKGPDCAGECGGPHTRDTRGICCGLSERGCDGMCFSGLVPDCKGACGGAAVTDDCGVCDGGNRDKGCDGVCFSKKTDCCAPAPAPACAAPVPTCGAPAPSCAAPAPACGQPSCRQAAPVPTVYRPPTCGGQCGQQTQIYGPIRSASQSRGVAGSAPWYTG